MTLTPSLYPTHVFPCAYPSNLIHILGRVEIVYIGGIFQHLSIVRWVESPDRTGRGWRGIYTIAVNLLAIGNFCKFPRSSTFYPHRHSTSIFSTPILAILVDLLRRWLRIPVKRPIFGYQVSISPSGQALISQTDMRPASETLKYAFRVGARRVFDTAILVTTIRDVAFLFRRDVILHHRETSEGAKPHGGGNVRDPSLFHRPRQSSPNRLQSGYEVAKPAIRHRPSVGERKLSYCRK